MAKLSGGVAVIKVGAATEVEQKQKQQKIEDAVAATRAAIEEELYQEEELLWCVAFRTR